MGITIHLSPDAALAPFRRGVAESGMADEVFAEVRNEVWRTDHGGVGSAS